MYTKSDPQIWLTANRLRLQRLGYLQRWGGSDQALWVTGVTCRNLDVLKEVTTTGRYRSKQCSLPVLRHGTLADVVSLGEKDFLQYAQPSLYFPGVGSACPPTSHPVIPHEILRQDPVRSGWRRPSRLNRFKIEIKYLRQSRRYLIGPHSFTRLRAPRRRFRLTDPPPEYFATLHRGHEGGV